MKEKIKKILEWVIHNGILASSEEDKQKVLNQATEHILRLFKV